MEDLFTVISQIYEIVKTSNSFIQILFFLIGVPVILFSYRIYKSKELRDSLMTRFDSLIKSCNIKFREHILFKSAGVYNNYIDSISFNSEIKNYIFKIILTEKKDTILSECEDFLNTYKNKEGDIEDNMFNLVNTIVDKYECRIKTKLIKRFKADGDIIYKNVYYNRFRQYHQKNVLFIVTAIRSFTYSRLTKEQKIYMLLNLIYTALELAILDCERVFDEMNGDLKEYEQKYFK